MSFLVADVNTVFPLTLVVNRAGVGGVTGLSPTVALRKGSDPTSYLDWSDNTFKTGGWAQRFAVLAEVENGHYQRMLSLPDIGAAPSDSFVAHFKVDNGGDVKGVAEDVILVSEDLSGDMSLLRKALTNRMEETPGNPGQLTLFDDDGLSILARWEIRDASGGAVIGTVGTPARRSARLP